MKQSVIISSVTIYDSPITFGPDANGRSKTVHGVININQPFRGVSSFFLTERQLTRLASDFNGMYKLLKSFGVNSTLEVEYLEHKQGDVWENKSTGETGTYSKDWSEIRVNSFTLAPDYAVKFAIAAMTSGSISTPVSAPVSQPVVEEKPVLVDDSVPNSKK